MSILTLQFSIIICTYKRPLAVLNILSSIELQSVLPFEVIIVDASLDNKTHVAIKNKFASLNILYFLVEGEHRGLTKQRNFGIDKLNSDTEIVIFLDDDLILEKEFCEKLISNFINVEIIGAEGYITNEQKWSKIAQNEVINNNFFQLDSYKYKLSARDKLRKNLGLYPSNMQP
jgi:glycosyltransferase involved in cell wall biosynthesis